MTEPDRTVAPLAVLPVSRQPTVGMPGTPPWRENQAAAAIGVGWPPRSDTSDRANADPAAQAEPGAETAADPVSGAGTTAADRVTLAPQADTASRPARAQPRDAALGNLMFL
ncbi:MAG TPA: hypothetical protein VKU77_33985 [Streptosporangiaceae bacterium]|nr:hypothetical protein [Streptosporangiaceae bacterium]